MLTSGQKVFITYLQYSQNVVVANVHDITVCNISNFQLHIAPVTLINVKSGVLPRLLRAIHQFSGTSSRIEHALY